MENKMSSIIILYNFLPWLKTNEDVMNQESDAEMNGKATFLSVSSLESLSDNINQESDED